MGTTTHSPVSGVVNGKSRGEQPHPGEPTEGKHNSGAVPLQDDSESETAPAVSTAGQRRRLWAILLPALVLVNVALVITASLMLHNVRQTDADKTTDTTVVETARQVVVNLTTLNHASADADINRILAGTTGTFRDQFSNASGSFRQVLDTGQVDSTGDIKEAGLIDANDDTAHVLVAAASTVKNTDAPNGESRVYRMKVTLEHVDNAWLVSNVEFVS